MNKSITRPDLSRRSMLRRRIGCHRRRDRKFSDFEMFQYVFTQRIFCALPVAPLVPLGPLMTIAHEISGLGRVGVCMRCRSLFAVAGKRSPNQGTSPALFGSTIAVQLDHAGGIGFFPGKTVVSERPDEVGTFHAGSRSVAGPVQRPAGWTHGVIGALAFSVLRTGCLSGLRRVS